MYDFCEVAKGQPIPSRVGDAVRAILMSDPEVWRELEPYMLPPGIEGSRQFDHMQVVNILRKYDKGELLKPYPAGRVIFDAYTRETRKAGFKLQHGRITGLLEKKEETDQPLESGEPDVE